MVDDREHDWVRLHDPSTDAGALARIAGSRPEFAAQIAAHPNAYPQLIAWAAALAPSTAAAVGGNPAYPAATQQPAVAGALVTPTRAVTRARVPWLIVLGLFVVGLPIIAVLWNLPSIWTEGANSFGIVWAIAEMLPYLALLAVSLIAAPSVGRAIGAGACALLALLLAVLASPIPYYFGSYGGYALDFYQWSMPGMVVAVVIAGLAFAAWAISTPLRGAGYAALAILLPVTLAWYFVSSAWLWYFLRYQVDAPPVLVGLVLALLPAGLLLLVIWSALTWSRGSERRAAQAATARGAHPQAYPAYAGAAYMVPASQRTNTMAVLSLIFAFFFSLLAVIFGHVALGQIRRTGEQGSGMAVAGLILGYLGCFVGVAITIWLIASGVAAANSYNSYYE